MDLSPNYPAHDLRLTDVFPDFFGEKPQVFRRI